MKEQLISLFEYSDWVTGRLLKAAAPLSEEEFGRKVLPGFGSLHHTLAHILAAETVWLARWQGSSPEALLSAEDLPMLAVVRECWDRLMHERLLHLARLNEAALAETVRWTNTRGQTYALPRWQVMLHCANHSTHHRSEVAAILSELGHEPDSTDLLEFYLARAGQLWKPSH